MGTLRKLSAEGVDLGCFFRAVARARKIARATDEAARFMDMSLHATGYAPVAWHAWWTVAQDCATAYIKKEGYLGSEALLRRAFVTAVEGVNHDPSDVI